MNLSATKCFAKSSNNVKKDTLTCLIKTEYTLWDKSQKNRDKRKTAINHSLMH